MRSLLNPPPQSAHCPHANGCDTLRNARISSNANNLGGYRMYLVTGGLGFIGLHTARALLDEGEDVVLTQYRVAREPDFIKDELGKRAFVEQLDVTNKDAMMEIGKKHNITGIVHLAVPALNALSP